MSSLSLPATVRTALPRWLPLLLVGVAAAYLRPLSPDNLDVSWGLTMAEKVLDGQRLYVDIFEVNPPATMLLHMVPAILGRLSGWPADWFVDALAFFAAGLSLWLCDTILRRARIGLSARWTVMTIGAAALLILPAYTFGEREHVALILFMPVLAVSAVRVQGLDLDLPLKILVGICAGLTAIIKPHFAIPIVCVSATVALHVRAWDPLFALENWIAAILLAAYGVFVVIAFPEFVSDVMPMVMATYVPSKTPLSIMLQMFATPCWVAAFVLLALIRRRGMFDWPYSVLLAGSVGFLIAFYVQQKGWNYQSYPMLALILMALLLALIEEWLKQSVPPSAGRLKRMGGALTAAVIVGVVQVWMSVGKTDPTPLVEAVGAVKPHPKIMVMSDVLWVAFPLTRLVEGTFVQRFEPLWLTGSIWYRRKQGLQDEETEAQFDNYIARDKATFAEDIARHQPDVILVDHTRQLDWMGWANSYPPLAEQMKHYKKVKTVQDIDILRREPAR